MIILDTNLVSEPLKPKPDAAVLAWLDRQAPETLYLPTITVAELQAGIETLPVGKRRRALRSVVRSGQRTRVWACVCGHASRGQSDSLW